MLHNSYTSLKSDREKWLKAYILTHDFNQLNELLLQLRGDEHARDPDQLQLRQGDNPSREEAVDDVDAKEEGLRK